MQRFNGTIGTEKLIKNIIGRVSMKEDPMDEALIDEIINSGPGMEPKPEFVSKYLLHSVGSISETGKKLFIPNSLDDISGVNSNTPQIYLPNLLDPFRYISNIQYFNGYYVMIYHTSLTSNGTLVKSKDLQTWVPVDEYINTVLMAGQSTPMDVIDGMLFIHTNDRRIIYTKDLKTFRILNIADIHPNISTNSRSLSLYKHPTSGLWIILDNCRNIFSSRDLIEFNCIYPSTPSDTTVSGSSSLSNLYYCKYDDSIVFFQRSQFATANKGSWYSYMFKISSDGELIEQLVDTKYDLYLRCEYKDGLAALVRYAWNNYKKVDFYIYTMCSETSYKWTKTENAYSLSEPSGASLIYRDNVLYLIDGGISISTDLGVTWEKHPIYKADDISKVIF